MVYHIRKHIKYKLQSLYIYIYTNQTDNGMCKIYGCRTGGGGGVRVYIHFITNNKQTSQNIIQF